MEKQTQKSTGSGTTDEEVCDLCRITYSIYSNFPPMPHAQALNVETGEFFPFDRVRSLPTGYAMAEALGYASACNCRGRTPDTAQKKGPSSVYGDQFSMNGSYSPAKAKARRWKSRKATIANGRGKAASMPPGPDRDKVKAAADRFERNNSAVEHARLADDVYAPKPNGFEPEGWKNVSNDPAALTKYGLNQKDLSVSGSNFRVQVYKPDPAVFGTDMKPTIVFQGTDPTSWSDWANNAEQGMGADSPYYKRAVKIGQNLAIKGADVNIAGHSLGGGMASAASRASGLPTDTFNAAGLNPGTVAKYGATPIASQIQAFRVDGEVLTSLQESAALKGKIPAAVGTPYTLPGSGNTLSRHSMTQVIDGIEKQKRQDDATLTRAIANG
ncbi:hypothetical protein BH160DRAFT_1340 [Burkholderia sp. H160]|nr:hypothetical protein BH160DRAFT_1340 [Burkholderia sp. H160]